MYDRLGQQLGNYRLANLLGRGGFAEVYLADHVHLERQAAIKILRTQLSDQQSSYQFRQEARMIARLEHPHIVRILDFGVENSTPYLVMTHAPYGTLRQLYPRGSRLPIPMIISSVNQIAAALQYAHNQHIIHRDVKPENMLLGSHQELFLSDFGIAIQAHSTNSTGLQNMAGTLPYMAPEQIKAHPRPASDQYALAAVVYEWFCGTPPFQGNGPEIALKHLNSPPLPLAKLIPIEPGIEAVILQALAKDPKDRFASVQDFARALEQAVQQGKASASTRLRHAPQFTNSVPSTLPSVLSYAAPPVGSAPVDANAVSAQQTPSALPSGISAPLYPSTGQGITPASMSLSITPQQASFVSAQQEENYVQSQLTPARQRRSRRAVLLAGATALGGGLSWFAVTRNPLFSRTSLPTATVPLSLATPKSAPQATVASRYQGHTDDVEVVAWSPDGKRIASGGRDKTVQVWDAADGSHLYTYDGHANWVYGIAWSPDGSQIASGSFDLTAQIWEAETGTRVLTYHGHSGSINGLSWSPDGKRIASAGGDYTVQVWDAIDGNHAFTYRGHTSYATSVAWSPDGKRIVSASFDKTVQVWDAADGQHPFIYRGHVDWINAAVWSPDGKRVASAADDKTVQVWDATNGQHLFIYHGHDAWVATVAWSPDGKRIASASNEVVQVWDAINGNHVYTYRGHANTVKAVVWSPDGKRIASGSDDKTVQVWIPA